MSPATRPRDLPPTLGMTLVEGGAEFAVYAGHADSVEVCLFDTGDTDGSHRAPRPAHRAHPRHLVRLPPRRWRRASATACGPTARGARPRACATTRASCCSTPTPAPSRATCRWTPEVFAHRVDERLKGDDVVRGSPRQRRGRCRAASSSTTGFDWGDDRRPAHAARPTRSSTRRTSATSPCSTPRSPSTCAARMPGCATRPSSPTSRRWASRRSSCCRCTRSPPSPRWSSAG